MLPRGSSGLLWQKLEDRVVVARCVETFNGREYELTQEEKRLGGF